MSKTIPQLCDAPSVSFPYQAYLAAVRDSNFSGDIADNFADRIIAGTDNSVYQILPEAVLYPRSSSDIQIALAIASQPEHTGIIFSPRGGGTGTNGQSLNSGIVIDTSKYMTKILDMNLVEGWIDVEPGVVLDDLNAHLARYDRFFAPELSPSSRATLGGMCSTDACGKGSRIYGRTSDHIVQLDCLLANGEPMTIQSRPASEVATLLNETSKLGSIHRTIEHIVTDHAAEIAEVFPKMSRFMTGYNLTKVRDQSGAHHLQYLIAGSEGTLVCITKIRLRHLPKEKHKLLFLVKYPTFDGALDSAADLVGCNPLAIETVDDTIIALARKDSIWQHVSNFFTESVPAKAINLIEYAAESTSELKKSCESLKLLLDKASSRGELSYELVEDTAAIAHLWDLRKKGVGLLGNREGQRRPIPFVEDTAVPPEHLAAYIREFKSLLDKFGLAYGMFGHVDVGCLHVRPALDLQSTYDQELLRQISNSVRDLTLKYKGVFWGEHGRGFRSEYTMDYFGPTLYDDLRTIKTVFDPRGILNPGKIVSPNGIQTQIPKIDEVPLRGQRDRDIPRHTQESFQPAFLCNGNAACLSTNVNYVMCPSSKPYRDRLHSPKGRAMVLREWLAQLAGKSCAPNNLPEIQGKSLRSSYDFSHEVYDTMKKCLSCKACTNLCPIKVDIPEMKSQFLSAYHSRYRRPRADRLLAYGEFIHKNLIPFAPIYNLAALNPLSRKILAASAGIVDPPRLSVPTLAKRLKKLNVPYIKSSSKPQNLSRSVIILQDAMTSFFHAEVVAALIETLLNLGFRPMVHEFFANGKGQHVKGFRNAFRDTALANAKVLDELLTWGVPLIGLDPAITLTYREEYKSITGKVFPVELAHEWLSRQDLTWPATKSPDGNSYTLLLHCQEQSTLVKPDIMWQSLFKKLGLNLSVKSLGCCGMAGAFGHEACNLKESHDIFALSWQPVVDSLINQGKPVLLSGSSCSTQVHRMLKQKPVHPWEILANQFRASR